MDGAQDELLGVGKVAYSLLMERRNKKRTR